MKRLLYNLWIDCHNLYITLYNRYVDWCNRHATENRDELIPTDLYNEQVEEYNQHVDHYNT